MFPALIISVKNFTSIVLSSSAVTGVGIYNTSGLSSLIAYPIVSTLLTSGAGLSHIVGQNIGKNVVKAGETQAGMSLDMAALAAQTGAKTMQGIQKSRQDKLLIDLLKDTGKAKV